MVSNVVKLESIATPKVDQDTQDRKLVKIVQAYRQESEGSPYRKSRMLLDKQNWEAFMNRQDFSDKVPGMSAEFLPETANMIEQFAAFMKKGLIQFGDWFEIDLGKNSPISNESARELMMFYLNDMPRNGQDTIAFTEVFSDAIKVALMQAKMVFKTHGHKVKKKFFVANGDKLEAKEIAPWRLSIELVKNSAYWRDEKGRGLYKIHRVNRDWHEVEAMAESGAYDKAAVAKLKGMDYPDTNPDDWDADEIPTVSGRKNVVIDEVHGTLIDFDGKVIKRDCICAIANEKVVIRRPTDNPAWHGETPFDEINLIRVPYEFDQKALYDQVVPLNYALNEMFNLILDGGLAEVWGVKQLRVNKLADPTQVEGGISQGMTLAVTDELAAGDKVLENVTTGAVPGDALAVFNILSRSTRSAGLTNDIATGNLPSRQVKATEVVEASASQSVMMDAFVSNVEVQIGRVLKKAWLTILQNADDLLATTVNEAMTPGELFKFQRMSPAQRFATMGSKASIKVTGLSATIMRTREFQRIMAMLQVATTNPVLAREALKRFSPGKVITRLMKLLNLNPKDYEPSEEELAMIEKNVAMLAQQGGQQASARPTGEPGVGAEINQEMRPSNEA
jgi:hypothetical protein